MPKRAADSDDVDDSRDDADRVRERRQREEQRFRDLRQLSDWISALCEIRTKVYAMTPLEVSTATMRIGGRFDDDGSAMAAKIDAIIRRGVAMQTAILADVEYDINEIRVLVRALRDVIADEELLNAFDRLYQPTDGGESRLFRAPDDVRRLLAVRANPIQKIANFDVEYLDPYTKSWANNGILSIAGYTYNYAGQLIPSIRREPQRYAPGDADFVNDTKFLYDAAGYKIIATDALGWWALASKTHDYEFGIFFGAVLLKDFTHGLVYSSVPGKVFTFPADFNPENNWYHLLSAGPDKLVALRHAGTNQTGNHLILVRFLAVNHELGTISVANSIIVQSTAYTRDYFVRFALDSYGNVWHGVGDIYRRIDVYNSGGERIAQFDADGNVNDICNAEDGVWVTYMMPTVAYNKKFCANYRLAPAAAYNRGLLSA